MIKKKDFEEIKSGYYDQEMYPLIIERLTNLTWLIAALSSAYQYGKSGNTNYEELEQAIGGAEMAIDIFCTIANISQNDKKRAEDEAIEEKLREIRDGWN